MMRHFFLGIGSVALALSLLVSPGWAFECPSVIQAARVAMAKMKGDETRLATTKALVAEAERLHNTGAHDAAIEKANAALALLAAQS